MNTEVKMIRKLDNFEIKQRNTDEYFCATDLINAGNQWRFSQGKKPFNFSAWLNSKPTKEFLETLSNEVGKDVVIKGKTKKSQTWVHPFVFIDLALSISPELKTKVYKWVYDNLIEYRNNSGDSYKKMCGALYITQSNKAKYEDEIKKVAVIIQKKVGIKNWQEANQEQLKLRDKIHENIALLADVIRDRDMLYETAIRKALEVK